MIGTGEERVKGADLKPENRVDPMEQSGSKKSFYVPSVQRVIEAETMEEAVAIAGKSEEAKPEGEITNN